MYKTIYIYLIKINYISFVNIKKFVQNLFILLVKLLNLTEKKINFQNFILKVQKIIKLVIKIILWRYKSNKYFKKYYSILTMTHFILIKYF